jgi:glycosyltransferase involved in cell wall biosynthesis
MRRIAYLSPVNPVSSGISDYSEELLPYLGQYAQITLYLDHQLQPSNPELVRQLEIRPDQQLQRDHQRQPYDAILYHMGNSPAHFSIWEALQRTPGVVVLHDVVLHHFMLQYAANVRRDVEWYRREALQRYGAEGQRVANLMLRGQLSDAVFALPFCEDVLQCATGLITHSAYAQQQALALHPNLRSAVLPMGVPLPPEGSRQQARQRLGLPQDTILLASFGHVNPYKRVSAVLRTVRQLRQLGWDARYVLVGSVSPSFPLQTLIDRAGLAEAVIVTGYVERERFEAYVAAADLCLNLRHPTAGETSASLLRLLGAGRPTLVTASGSFTELPSDVAAQVDPDQSEANLLLAYCRLLIEQPALAAELGANARRYVAEKHTLEAAAAGYIAFLAQLYGWGEVRKQRQVLWDVAPKPREVQPILPVQATPQAIAPKDQPDPQLSIVAEALVGIGATEADAELLLSTAHIVEQLR